MHEILQGWENLSFSRSGMQDLSSSVDQRIKWTWVRRSNYLRKFVNPNRPIVGGCYLITQLVRNWKPRVSYDLGLKTWRVTPLSRPLGIPISLGDASYEWNPVRFINPNGRSRISRFWTKSHLEHSSLPYQELSPKSNKTWRLWLSQPRLQLRFFVNCLKWIHSNWPF